MTEPNFKSSPIIAASRANATPLAARDLPSISPSKSSGEAIGFDHLLDVTVPLTVELGQTRVSISGLSQFAPGTLIPLDREAHETVDILVSGKVIARGEVVTIGTQYGVRITSVSAM